eukprot:COSAG01_NODE_6462_length_3654_cov_4.264416_3_plen_224_part_00
MMDPRFADLYEHLRINGMTIKETDFIWLLRIYLYGHQHGGVPLLTASTPAVYAHNYTQARVQFAVTTAWGDVGSDPPVPAPITMPAASAACVNSPAVDVPFYLVEPGPGAGSVVVRHLVRAVVEVAFYRHCHEIQGVRSTYSEEKWTGCDLPLLLDDAPPGLLGQCAQVAPLCTSAHCSRRARRVWVEVRVNSAGLTEVHSAPPWFFTADCRTDNGLVADAGP